MGERSSDKTMAEVSRELWINDDFVRRWCQEHKTLEAIPQTTTSKDEEIRRLRPELASVKTDAEKLKKAALSSTCLCNTLEPKFNLSASIRLTIDWDR